MFPLKEREVIRGWQAHINAGLGGATDYVAIYAPFYIPFDGTVTHVTGPQGGLQLKLTRPNGDRLEFFHLKSIAVPDGKAREGQVGGITGNSGLLKPGAPPYIPHLHLQIFNKAGVRLDPEKYTWDEQPTTPMPIKFPVSLITTQPWTAPQVQEAISEVLKASDARLEVMCDSQQKTWPAIPFSQDRVDDDWYRANIPPLCSGLPMLHLSTSEWHATNQGYETPLGISFRADEGETIYFSQSQVTVKAFVQNFVHELCHRLCRITGQPDITHQFMYPPTGVWNPKAAYSQLDYAKLTQGVTMPFVKKTINLDGAIGVALFAGEGTTTDPSILADLNSIFGVNLQQSPGGGIPTDIKATKA